MRNAFDRYPLRPKPISRGQLIAYAEGDLGDRDRHEVEMQLADDPLLAEAIEGLEMSGALESLVQLEEARPLGGSNGNFRSLLLITLIVVIGIGVRWVMTDEGSKMVVKDDHGTIENVEQSSIEEDQHIDDRIEVEKPVLIERNEIRSGSTEAFRNDDEEEHSAIDRGKPVQRLDGRSIEADALRTDVDRPAPKRDRRNGLQLHYLHELKIVHSKELHHGKDPRIPGDHLPADRADREEPELDRSEREIGYLKFMDKALGYFDREEFRLCLIELQLLLEQYPDDVNALFYAGMCDLELGNMQRARSRLHRAAIHPIDVFREEAEWYHALALQGVGEIEKAQAEFDRIAEENEFYAERAREQLKKIDR